MYMYMYQILSSFIDIHVLVVFFFGYPILFSVFTFLFCTCALIDRPFIDRPLIVYFVINDALQMYL